MLIPPVVHENKQLHDKTDFIKHKIMIQEFTKKRLDRAPGSGIRAPGSHHFGPTGTSKFFLRIQLSKIYSKYLEVYTLHYIYLILKQL